MSHQQEVTREDDEHRITIAIGLKKFSARQEDKNTTRGFVANESSVVRKRRNRRSDCDRPKKPARRSRDTSEEIQGFPRKQEECSDRGPGWNRRDVRNDVERDDRD